MELTYPHPLFRTVVAHSPAAKGQRRKAINPAMGYCELGGTGQSCLIAG
jgi:hypothetical protein